jgi:hypothetical protein
LKWAAGDPDAALKFRQIIRANEILSDEAQRAAYLPRLAPLGARPTSVRPQTAQIVEPQCSARIKSLAPIVGLRGPSTPAPPPVRPLLRLLRSTVSDGEAFSLRLPSVALTAHVLEIRLEFGQPLFRKCDLELQLGSGHCFKDGFALRRRAAVSLACSGRVNPVQLGGLDAPMSVLVQSGGNLAGFDGSQDGGLVQANGGGRRRKSV